MSVRALLLGLVLAGVWGMRWGHALSDHSHTGHHHHHSHDHSGDGPERHSEDCQLCQWIVGWFEVVEPLSFTPFTVAFSSSIIPSSEGTFWKAFFRNSGVRGPPARSVFI